MYYGLNALSGNMICWIASNPDAQTVLCSFAGQRQVHELHSGDHLLMLTTR